MNQTSGGAPYVGTAFGGGDAAAMEPLKVPEFELKKVGVNHLLKELTEEQHLKLNTYLTGRLSAGVIARDRRTKRYGKIDRLISTWQKLSPEDSAR